MLRMVRPWPVVVLRMLEDCMREVSVVAQQGFLGSPATSRASAAAPQQNSRTICDG